MAIASANSSERLARVDLAGGDDAHNVLSVLGAEHSCGAGLFQYFDTVEARGLRLVCHEFKAAVAAFPWDDAPAACITADEYFTWWVKESRRTRIHRNLGAWRASFSRARSANISVEYGAQNSFTDADFVHLHGVRRFDMSFCSQKGITDAAFAHLEGLEVLNMAYCNQQSITAAAFAHLAGIHTLSMSCCNQETITDAAFAHLAGIHTLNLNFCNQQTITDAAFVHFAGIHTLNMSYCTQRTITPAGLAPLRGAARIITDGCSAAITAATALLLTG